MSNGYVPGVSQAQFGVGLGIDSFEGVTLLSGLKEKNIYGDGRELNVKINIEANFASKTVLEKVEKNGGKLILKK